MLKLLLAASLFFGGMAVAYGQRAAEPVIPIVNGAAVSTANPLPITVAGSTSDIAQAANPVIIIVNGAPVSGANPLPVTGSGIVGNCTTAGGVAYYPSTGTTIGCSSGVTASNTALTLGSGVTLTAPDSSTWMSSGISGTTINNSAIGGTTAAAGKFTTLQATSTFTGADSGTWGTGGIASLTDLSVLATVAATVATDQAQASGGSTLLPFASTSGIAVGQIVVGTSIPVGTQVASIVSTAQVTRAATGTTTSAGKLVDFSNTTGFAQGQQCTDTTAPTAIGAGNVIASIQAGISITLTSNLVGTVTSGDTIVCDPVVTLNVATSAAIPAATNITFDTNHSSISTSSNIYDAGDLSIVGNSIAGGIVGVGAYLALSNNSALGAANTSYIRSNPAGSMVLNVTSSGGIFLDVNAGAVLEVASNVVTITGVINATGPNVTSGSALTSSIIGGTATTGTAGSIDITAGAASGAAGVGGSVVITMGTATGGGGAVAGTLQLVNLTNVGAADSMCYASGTGIVSWTVLATACVVSDENAKDEMVPLDPLHSLEIVANSNPVSFVYRPEMGLGVDHHLGFGAQTLALIAPELVVRNGPSSDSRLAVKQLEMTPVTWAAIKELKAEFDEYRREHP